MARHVLRQKLDGGAHAGQLAAPMRHQQRRRDGARAPAGQHAHERAGCERGAGDPVGQAREAETGRCRLQEQCRFVGLQPQARRHVDGIAAALQPPWLRARVKPVVLREVGRHVGRTGPREIGWRRDDDDRRRRERPLHERGIGQRCEMAAHRDVEAFLRDVDEAVAPVARQDSVATIFLPG